MTNPTTIKIDEVEYVRRDSIPTQATGSKGPLTLVRSVGAGVHVGELVSYSGQEVTLANARRLWYWKGAFTLSAVATKGVASGSRISVPVPEIIVLGVVEIIPVSTTAAVSLTKTTE